MHAPRPLIALLTLTLGLLTGCVRTTDYVADDDRTGSAGTLILIGGGLEKGNADVFRRMIALATKPGERPRVLVATAASLDEAASLASVTTSFHTYDPAIDITTINRSTATDAAVAAIDAAHFVYFTGGDQKRIIDLYRPAGVDRPEATALRRLLARAGTIAGTSAGLAMMSDPMFLSGSSDDALESGPKIGPGMGFIPNIITDSHFVERARLGRLFMALKVSNRRFGVGVAENAASEFDLSGRRLFSLTNAPTVVVDIAIARRDGAKIVGLLAKTLVAGDSMNFDVPESAPATYDTDFAAAFSKPAALTNIADPSSAKRHSLFAYPRPDGWTEIEIHPKSEDVPPPFNDKKPTH